MRAVAPEAALSPAALLDRLAALPQARGLRRGLRRLPWRRSPEAPRLATKVEAPGAAAVAALAAARLVGAAFDLQALFALEPHYVRKSEAEVKFPHGLGPGAGK